MQQQNRAVTFLFRERQNFTVRYRTEIGAEVLQLMDADTPAQVRNDLVDASLEWMDVNTNPAWRGRSRIFSPSDANPAGRNFLVSSYNFLVPVPPSPPWFPGPTLRAC